MLYLSMLLIIIIAMAIHYRQVNPSFFFLGIGLLIFALTGVNTLYIQSIGSGMGIYSGLFQVTVITQFIDLFITVMVVFILLVWYVSFLYDIRNETKPILTNTLSFLYLQDLFSKLNSLCFRLNSFFIKFCLVSTEPLFLFRLTGNYIYLLKYCIYYFSLFYFFIFLFWTVDFIFNFNYLDLYSNFSIISVGLLLKRIFYFIYCWVALPILIWGLILTWKAKIYLLFIRFGTMLVHFLVIDSGIILYYYLNDNSLEYPMNFHEAFVLFKEKTWISDIDWIKALPIKSSIYLENNPISSNYIPCRAEEAITQTKQLYSKNFIFDDEIWSGLTNLRVINSDSNRMGLSPSNIEALGYYGQKLLEYNLWNTHTDLNFYNHHIGQRELLVNSYTADALNELTYYKDCSLRDYTDYMSRRAHSIDKFNSISELFDRGGIHQVPPFHSRQVWIIDHSDPMPPFTITKILKKPSDFIQIYNNTSPDLREELKIYYT